MRNEIRRSRTYYSEIGRKELNLVLFLRKAKDRIRHFFFSRFILETFQLTPDDTGFYTASRNFRNSDKIFNASPVASSESREMKVISFELVDTPATVFEDPPKVQT
ncbi:hypothetical protein CDAR_432541 [Caerostris darwini]|uniref:Uncharacterized protein n=1 Tax=Caerostris darwini TaxID=1538125 RepID=A0AAV4U360_9ARAC|nr:hypothetical protein CDAR_432541 [Caerostris darwini]